MSSGNACRRVLFVLAGSLLSTAARASSHESLRYYSPNAVGVSAAAQEKSRPGVALRWSVLPPIVGNGAPGAELAASISRRSDFGTIQLNAAAGLSGERRLVSFGGLILQGPDHWLLRPLSEIFVECDLFGATEVSGLVGALYGIGKNLSANAGFRVANLDQPDLSAKVAEIRAGLTWLF